MRNTHPLTGFVSPFFLRGAFGFQRSQPVISKRPFRGPKRTTMSSSLNPLPSVDALKSADLMQSVQHARDLLLSPRSEQTKSLMATMLGTSVGARGFFISLLTDPEIKAVGGDGVESDVRSLVKAAAAESTVSDLLVKNAVMPATMVVSYTREGKTEEAEDSRRTMERALKLLGETIEKGGLIESKVKSMRKAMQNPEDSGTEYSAFVQKWGYDQEQREAAAAAIAAFC